MEAAVGPPSRHTAAVDRRLAAGLHGRRPGRASIGTPAMTSREWAAATAHRAPGGGASDGVARAAVVDHVDVRAARGDRPHRVSNDARPRLRAAGPTQVDARSPPTRSTSSERMRQYAGDLNRERLLARARRTSTRVGQSGRRRDRGGGRRRVSQALIGRLPSLSRLTSRSSCSSIPPTTSTPTKPANASQKLTRARRWSARARRAGRATSHIEPATRDPVAAFGERRDRDASSCSICRRIRCSSSDSGMRH